MTDNHIFLSIAAFAALITASGIVLKTLKVFAKFYAKLDEALPVLFNISEQFKNNGGSTIKDKLDKLVKGQADLEIADRYSVKIAEDARLVAQTNSKIVNELSLVQGEEIKHIKDYLHEQMHGIRNEMSKNILLQMQGDKRMERIESRLDNMMPLVSRHRESFEEDEK